MLIEVDTIIYGVKVSTGPTDDGAGIDSSGEDWEVMASALELDVIKGEPSGRGVGSPDGRVEVTVLPARVLVRVCVEVENNVVVGSAPGSPPSREAKDARGRERRTEVSRRRMVVGMRRPCAASKMETGASTTQWSFLVIEKQRLGAQRGKSTLRFLNNECASCVLAV